MEGYGEYHMSEGKIYFGFYKNDKRDGFGIHYFPKDTFYVGFWKEGKQNGFGKYIHNGTIKYCFWNMGKKEKVYQNEEEFFDNIGEEEKRCEEFFRWDIDKLKEYLRFEGYYHENDNLEDNNNNNKKKKIRKNRRKKKEEEKQNN